MRERLRVLLTLAVGLGVVAGFAWLGFIGLRGIWRALISINSDLAIAIIAAAATVLASTIAVMLGRYFERKRDIEAHFRTEKIKIYDEFLRELFRVLHSAEGSTDDNIVPFLKEWQRKLVLWGGNDVLRTYFIWINRLKSQHPDAQTVFLMDDFFRALRADIGQSSRRLKRGAFANLILRHADFFLALAEKNPSITLTEVAALEKKHFGEEHKG
jgi:hypothetical protein